MTDVLQTALTFPTQIWSVRFALCAVYWLVAATGLIGRLIVATLGAVVLIYLADYLGKRKGTAV